MPKKIYKIELKKNQFPSFYKVDGKLIQVEEMDQNIEDFDLLDAGYKKIKHATGPRYTKIVFPLYRIKKDNLLDHIKNFSLEVQDIQDGDFYSDNIILIVKDYGEELLIGLATSKETGGIEL